MLAEQNNQLAQLNTILSTITDGILVCNASQNLLHANPAASKILDIPVKALVGKQAASMFELPAFLYEAIEQRKPVTDVEANLRIGVRAVTCLMSLDYVLNKNDLQWIVMTLRTEKQVRNLVTQQVGASAPLTLEDIPGESPQIQRVRTFIKSAAKARACVLIRGETGTGKNVLANAIHNVSQRRDGPFVIFACSSIPTELALRELLGFDEVNDGKRLRSRPSKFELAHGGTLYFQDVDALPLEAQAVLLNALEVGFIQRLGSRRPIEIDVRVVASTTASIEKLISQGSFRADLYYRLSTFAITLPPLRERPRDIPLVVDRILKRLAQQWGYPGLGLDAGVIDVLRRYPWPGNVREIEAVLGRAAAQSGNAEKITLDMLPHTVRYTTNLTNFENDEASIQPLNEVERQAILNTARLCQGNVTLMAQALEISRTTLWRRMRQYGIHPKEYRRSSGEAALALDESADR
jgi:transcriptional activator for dhaKLM operon